MKYYKDSNNKVYAYDLDGSQDYVISSELIAITVEEANSLIENPTNKDILNNLINYKRYLESTDHKVLPYYEPKQDEDINIIITKRKEARNYIRANKG
jgi:hypothetical protein